MPISKTWMILILAAAPQLLSACATEQKHPSTVEIRVGETLAEVERSLELTTEPTPVWSAVVRDERRYQLKDRGVMIFFDGDAVQSIRLDAPFDQKLYKVRLGELRPDVLASLGKPDKIISGFTGAAYLYNFESHQTVRYDFDQNDRLVTMLVLLGHVAIPKGPIVTPSAAERPTPRVATQAHAPLAGLSRPSVTVPVSASRQPAARDIKITYPLPSEDDVLEVRRCPLTWGISNMCNMLGTQGPVKKISWMEDRLHVLDGYIQFNRTGQLEKKCARGRTDFQGWGCGYTPFAGYHGIPDVLHTELDSKGRIIRRLHFQFDHDHYDTCSYDDSSVPSTSECNDGTYIHRYTYDPSGRPLSYSRRHIPRQDETPEELRRLDRAYALDLTFVYKDDDHGNWTEYQTIQDPRASDSKYEYSPVRRTIEYY